MESWLARSPRKQLLSSATEDWTGYGGIGDYANSNGNTLEVMTAGHQIRDRVFDSLPPDTIDTGEVFDCVVVGGGVSGLSAAVFFQTYAGPKLTCLVLDNHPVFGGEAKRNEFIVDGQRIMGPQGADHFQVPLPYSFMARFFEVIGLNWREFEYQKWTAFSRNSVGDSFEDAERTRRILLRRQVWAEASMWLIDPWKKKLQGAPIPEKMRAELLKYNREQKPGLPFEYPGDEKSRQLDHVTIERYLTDTYGLSRETIQTFMAEEGGGFGAGPDVVSAYCIYAFDVDRSIDEPSLSFPGGNDGIARHMVKTAHPRFDFQAPTHSRRSAATTLIFRRSIALVSRPEFDWRVPLYGCSMKAIRPRRPSLPSLTAAATTLPHQSAIRCHGRRLLDDKAGHSRPACHPSASLRSVLSFALHDGECSSAELAVSLQIGDLRMPVV